MLVTRIRETPKWVVTLLATFGVLLFGHFLERFGLLQYTIGFLWGIVFTILAEFIGFYYFLVKFETKGNAKLQNLRKEREKFTDETYGSYLNPSMARSAIEKMTKSGAKHTIDGTITIQFLGKKKAKAAYYCVLKGDKLYYTKKDQKNSSNAAYQTKVIALEGTQVRRLDDGEIKGMKYAIELLHPNRKIVYKIDYLYLIFDSEMDMDRWFFALLTVCMPHNGFVDLELNKRLHDRFKTFWNAPESGNWINAIISRFWLNLRVSQSLNKKLTDKLALRLGEKIEEKHLQDYIENITIQDLDLGTHPPNIEAIMLLPPDQNGDLLVDYFVNYSHGDIKLALSCDIKIKSIAVVPIKFAVILRALAGKMVLRCSPFPAQRFCISFYEEPKMEFDIDMAVGEKAGNFRNLIMPKLKELVIDRLKLALIERFVAPHRKYFRIPGTPKSDPEADHETTIQVKSNVNTAAKEVASSKPSSITSGTSSQHVLASSSAGSLSPEPSRRSQRGSLSGSLDSSAVDILESLVEMTSTSVQQEDTLTASADSSETPQLSRHLSSQPLSNQNNQSPLKQRVELEQQPLNNPADDPTRLSARFKEKVNRFKNFFKGDTL